MVVNYPNGMKYTASKEKPQAGKQETKKIIYAKRGMSLEDELNDSNIAYLQRERAVIHKKPTPIQIVNVDYPRRSAAVIKEAYFKQASTTDYNGVYRGHYIDFEAKETKNKRSFPLKNFHDHQILHMRQCLKQKGICFVILKFTTLNRLFLLEAEQLMTYWDNQKDTRKSITITELEKNSFELYYSFSPLIPYLDAVDQIIEQSITNI